MKRDVKQMIRSVLRLNKLKVGGSGIMLLQDWILFFILYTPI